MLTALLSGAGCAYAAVNRGRPALPWFVIGAVGNVVALAVAPFVLSPADGGAPQPSGIPAGLRKVPSTRQPRPCPHCNRTVHPSARRCAGCGTEIEPLVDSEIPSA